MKRKITQIFLVLVLLLTVFSPIAYATDIDFTIWTETDPDDRLTVTSSSVVWENYHTGDSDAGVIRDYGQDGLWFNSIYEFDFTTDTGTEGNTQSTHFMVSNNSTLDVVAQQNESTVQSITFSTNMNVGSTNLSARGVVHSNNGVYDFMMTGGLALGTTYYGKVVIDKDAGAQGTIYMYVHTDSARTNLFTSGEQILYAPGHYRYMMAGVIYNSLGTVYAHYGSISNLTEVYSGTLPIVTSTPAQVTTLGAYVNFIANSQDTGLDMTSYGIQWGTSTGSYSANTTYATSTNYLSSNLLIRTANLTWGQTYFYRVFAVAGEYGYSSERSFLFNPDILTIVASTPNWQQLGDSDNFSAAFRVNVSPLTYGDNVTGRLGDNPNSDDYVLTQQVLSTGQFAFITDDYPLSANNTYYYQGIATVNGTDYYSNIGSFKIIAQVIPTAPTVILTGLDDVTNDYQWLDSSADNVAIELEARITSGNLTDIYYIAFDLSLGQASGYLTTPIYTYSPTTISPDGTFRLVIFLSSQAWYDITDTIYIQAVATDGYGLQGRSPIQFWIASQSTSVGDTGIDTVSPIQDTLDGVKASFGLTGIMGTWALMFVILMAVALLFAPVVFSVKDVARGAIAVVWALISISILGAFIFTGQLGIWPVLILVGGVVMLLLVITSVKLSGQGGG